MFESLTDRLNQVFTQLRRRGRLSESDVDTALKDVRLALLEADVHYGVVKTLIGRIRERAVGVEVSRALNPAQQVIKIVNQELITTLGQPVPLNISVAKPCVIMLLGLQGSGKTTTAAKLASLLRLQGERVLLAAVDTYRPAAVQQLQTLGQRLNVDVFHQQGHTPPEIAVNAKLRAAKSGHSVLILDTAGRSQLDETLMDELKEINIKTTPGEMLLVVDAMTGQEAVNIAQGFRKAVEVSGMVLAKMDGDARGGAAISIREVTGVPIKFLGTGEDLEDLEVFDPARLASRILGMGDMLGLIEKAESKLDAEKSAKSAEKLISGEFDLEDFAEQIKQIRKIGPLGKLMSMMPGNAAGGIIDKIDPLAAEKNFTKIEAIICSMTPLERQKPKVIDASRKRRIALGSGTNVQDVNRLLKQHREMQRMMKHIKKSGTRGLPQVFD